MQDDVAEPGDSQGPASPAEPRCGSSSGGEAAATAASLILTRDRLVLERDAAQAKAEEAKGMMMQYLGAASLAAHLIAELDREPAPGA